MSLQWTTITDPSDTPCTPGVYMYMAGNKIIYIGKSLNLKARLKSHAQNARHSKHERLIQNNITKIKITLTDSDFLATLLEAKLIAQHLPQYNRVLRDNKSYLYITLNMRDEYPKPRLIRHHDLLTNPDRKKNYKVFGPFKTRKVAEDILRTIRQLIPYCQQKRVGSRACFYSKLGLCNPCPSTIIKKTDKLQYRKQLNQIKKILSGNITPVLKKLRSEMEQASGKEDFEAALLLRDRITRFESSLAYRSFTDGRVVTYSSSDKGLEKLSSILQPNLGVRPLGRIEGYDASTFQLTHSVVSMVVATDGQMDSSQYRRFRIKNPRVRSDFGMLEEALRRRLKHKSWPRPDLLVIDGGRPQLRRLQPLLDQLQDPPLMIGLAKHPDKIILPAVNNNSVSYTNIPLASDSPALHLLQRIRDESHRFANNYRKLLDKKSKQI